ncbi:MAG: hypothetical protein KF699_08060 [Phycisphaeraceae bacterium]|nr:hypothetical protein [Phycisphaeraceae bacterium]
MLVPFALMAATALAAHAAQPTQGVSLRPVSPGERAARLDGIVESASAAGVLVRLGEGASATRVLVGLDRLAHPLDAAVAEALARASDAAKIDLAALSVDAWRARTRLERGDWDAAEPVFERIASVAVPSGGPTGAVVAQGLLVCRLARDARAGAVWSWLDYVHIVRNGPGLAEAPAGSLLTPPAGVATTWEGGRITPFFGGSPVDIRTGLAPNLPPIWTPAPALESIIRAPGWDRLTRPEGGPVAELAALYRAAAAFETGTSSAIPAPTSAQDGVRLVREIVTARVGEPDARAQARGALTARLGAESVDRWTEAWCRAGIGRSLVREPDAEIVLSGVLELLHVPARFAIDQPYAAGVALATAAVALADLGDATGAATLKAELESTFSEHSARSWPAFQRIGLARTGSALGNSIGTAVISLVLGAQPERMPTPPAELLEAEVAGPDDALEAYLRRLNLSTLLARHLEARVASLGRDQRGPVAERLARLYVDLLERAPTAEERAQWEQRAQKLLRDVPEADGHELRISLVRVLYLRAEETCERARLRMATPEEIVEAERVLRQVEPQFREIAAKAHRRVDGLEKIENLGDATEEMTRQLADARRVRSLSFFYAGWCQYYLAMLTRPEPGATEALKNFGWLLNSPNGRSATLERLPVSMLRFEHVARAAVGCGLASSLRNADGEAMRWLETVAEAPDVTPAVRAQLLSRQISVLAQARRWSDMERLIRKARNSDRAGAGENVRPLEVFEARLLAVVTLEADARVSGPQLEHLARIALGDLVARGEIGHVLDLTAKFGTAPIGETGFIVHYVRGVKAYDEARAAHRESGSDPDEPASRDAVVNQYRAAADLLRAALHQSDAANYRPERARAALFAGRAMFYGNDFSAAADLFAQAWEHASTVDPRSAESEEALWLAVVALDRDASRSGAPATATQRRAQTGAIFLQTYPDSPRAARLLLMRAAAGDVGDDEALRVLESVPKDAPMYESARRQIARILYNRFRAGTGTERDFAALRFVTVAEELLAMDRRAATATAGGDKDAAARAVLRARQLLDALLGVAAPDADRALSTLELVRTLARITSLDISEHEAELTFRELQIALLRARDAEAAMLAARLANMPTAQREFLPAADRLLYRRAADRFRAARGAEARREAAAAVVQFGTRVVEHLPGAGADGTPDNAAAVAVFATVAAAAFELWSAPRGAESDEGPAEMRDLAMQLDRAILRAAPRNEESLRRLAVTTDAAGDHRAALDCWSVLLAAAPSGSDAWFEARYHALRVLLKIDAARAKELLAQHKVLYPAYGPEPWGDRIRQLEASMSGASSPSNGGAP